VKKNGIARLIRYPCVPIRFASEAKMSALLIQCAPPLQRLFASPSRSPSKKKQQEGKLRGLGVSSSSQGTGGSRRPQSGHYGSVGPASAGEGSSRGLKYTNNGGEQARDRAGRPLACLRAERALLTLDRDGPRTPAHTSAAIKVRWKRMAS